MTSTKKTSKIQYPTRKLLICMLPKHRQILKEYKVQGPTKVIILEALLGQETFHGP